MTDKKTGSGRRTMFRRLLCAGVSALLFVSTFLATVPLTEKDVYADDALDLWVGGVRVSTGNCTGPGWGYI